MKKPFTTTEDFRALAICMNDLALKAGAGDCRTTILKKRLVEINYRNRQPEVIMEAATRELTLEVYVNNRYAAATTPDLREGTLRDFIKDTINNALLLEEDPFRSLPDSALYGKYKKTDLELADPDHEKLTPEQRHTMAGTIETSCSENGGSNVLSVQSGEYDEISEEFIHASNGFEASSIETVYHAGASITIKDDGDRRPAGSNWVAVRMISDMPGLIEIGRTAAERTLDLARASKRPTGRIPIIIENRVASRILNGFLGALTGNNIQQNRSFLADKKARQIGSKVFSLINDPLIPRGMGSVYYDSDGFPAKRMELVSNGILKEFLINWYYSRKLECEPTTGTVANLVIPPGNRSVEAIIKDLGRCLLITGFIGGNANTTTGDFSRGIIGKLFDNGHFVQNIAGMNLAGNHLTFWNKLTEAANDPYLYSSARLPSLVFDDVVVSGV